MRGTGISKIYSGRMDQYLYIDTLENGLMSSVELLVDSDHHWIFQQDNAPCYKSKFVKEYFDENHINVMPWPARSPDLNPIEHVWNLIDKKLIGKRLSNLAELELAIVKEWNDIEASVCVNLIESMPRRIGLCLEANGGHFEY